MERNFTVDQLSVRVFDTRAQMGEAAAKAVSECIRSLLAKKEAITMIFAAAPSQNEFLAALAADKSIDFTRITACHMDEYIGLDKDAPQGFGNFLKERLFDLCPFRAVHLLDGQAPDSEAACERYAAILGENPVDIVCMGIGENGHIAFNDPWVADFNDPKAVKVVELDETCRMQQVHDGCFEKLEDVPTHAITLTIPTLVGAGYQFCMVPAKTKAQAVRDTLQGPVSVDCPASILRTKPGATLWLDGDSASLLAR